MNTKMTPEQEADLRASILRGGRSLAEANASIELYKQRQEAQKLENDAAEAASRDAEKERAALQAYIDETATANEATRAKAESARQAHVDANARKFAALYPSSGEKSILR